ELDPHVDSQQRPRRAVLVGSIDPGLLPRHLACRPGHADRKRAVSATVSESVRRGIVATGASAPLGATGEPDGVKFSVFSKRATLIELLRFDSEGGTEPARVIALDVKTHRTYHYWHAFVPNLTAGQVYGYRAHGPFAPERGLRFDADKVLIDPYGLAVAVPDSYDRAAARRPGSNASVAMKSVVADPDSYDWEGGVPLK